MKKKDIFSEKGICRAAAVSASIEGLDFNRARKDKKSIEKLKAYGRAYSILH